MPINVISLHRRGRFILSLLKREENASADDGRLSCRLITRAATRDSVESVCGYTYIYIYKFRINRAYFLCSLFQPNSPLIPALLSN